MAAGNFGACLAVILNNEKGFNANEHDGVGATNLGITQKTLSIWMGRPATVQDVKDLTPAAVSPIYQAMYWNASHCEYLPAGIDLMILDEGVNEGPGTANRHLQEALGVSVDGLVGPVTLRAATDANADGLIDKLAQVRDDYYKTLDNYPTDGKGWLARVQRTAADAKAMAQQKPPAV